MKPILKILFILSILISSNIQAQPADVLTGEEILANIDRNMVIDQALSVTTMNVYNRRGQKLTSQSKVWSQGPEKALVEYLSPARQRGVKMLKLEDKLWIYTPEPTDRIVTISGHMLRQSVNGSDLSYEDMVESKSLVDAYDAQVSGTETCQERLCWVVALTARVEDVVYHSRKLWVDVERWIPLKEERYAKSGKLLKKTEILEVFQQDGRWLPKVMKFKDMLSQGQGTEYIIESIDFKVQIPDHLFTKASLRK